MIDPLLSISFARSAMPLLVHHLKQQCRIDASTGMIHIQKRMQQRRDQKPAFQTSHGQENFGDFLIH